jgi:hypothetical protein
MRPWLFRKETPFIGDPDVVNRNSEKMTLGKSVLIVKVFVIDPRSKSLGKSTALNGSWQQSSLFYGICFSLSVLYRYFMGFLGEFSTYHIQQNPVHNVCLFVTLCCEVRGYFYILSTHILTLAR